MAQRVQGFTVDLIFRNYVCFLFDHYMNDFVSTHSIRTNYITVGVDASNIRAGGGQTHLVELIRATIPHRHQIEKLVIFGSKRTLDTLPNMPWLEKVNPNCLNGNFIQRLIWQKYKITTDVRRHKCDVLFVPGGSYAGKFHPIVAMSQNLLPFMFDELFRFGISAGTFKGILLRITQTLTFRNADGVIFLTKFAKNTVSRSVKSFKGRVTIIPHGIDNRFLHAPKKQLDIDKYSAQNPFRILYVSVINQYKHQWNVVQAVSSIRAETGWPIVLEFVGPAYPPSLRRLKSQMEIHDPRREWIFYRGAMPFDSLHQVYTEADLGLFASSCENLPIILLETMSAGLPIACSNLGPMPEVLQDGGLYFNPESCDEIRTAVRSLVSSTEERERLASISFSLAKGYSWSTCADKTFDFLFDAANRYHQLNHD